MRAIQFARGSRGLYFRFGSDVDAGYSRSWRSRHSNKYICSSYSVCRLIRSDDDESTCVDADGGAEVVIISRI